MVEKVAPPSACPEIWMSTFTGKRFDPINPDVRTINIEDIAHALANLCRWGGHTSEFYSVAEHSYLVSKCCGEGYELDGLLHDAAEAYVGDMLKPIKYNSRLGAEFKKFESRVTAAIAQRFGLGSEPPSVKIADMRVLMAEARDLMRDPKDWPYFVAYGEAAGGPWPEEPLLALNPVAAERLFLARYRELTR